MRPFPSHVWVGAFFASTLSFSSLADIYDDASKFDSTPQTVCLYQGEPIHFAVSARQEYINSLWEPCDPNVRYCESKWSFGGTTVKQYETYCVAEFTKSFTQTDTYNQKQSTHTSEEALYGEKAEADMCPPDDPLGAQHTFKNKWCYDPNELSEKSSCPKSTSDDEFVLPASGTTQSHVCVSHNDGSRCSYNLSEDSTYYVADFENSGCYGSEDALPNPQPAPDGYCDSVGANKLMCTENKNSMCPNGVCPTGCGTYAYDGSEQFVCFADDTDNDNVPNYSDPDIDGDGIPNIDDPDWDGDGINDPAFGTGRPGSSGSEGQDGAVGTGDGSGSGSGSGASATEIGEELKDKLTELGDFSTTEFDAAIAAKQTSYTESLDAFNSDENLEFTRAISESTIEDDLNLGQYFSGSSCNANIAIPLSTQSLDLCEPLQKAQPYLYVIFALSTFWYCITLIVGTLRGTE